MKFIALLSGGKDSCYNVMKCIQHGHELIALANLMPSSGDNDISSYSSERQEEDADSFMYQTAAHNLLPAIAVCMDVPLVRQCILGTAMVQTLQYDNGTAPAAGDEVEDLFLLLQEVKRLYPDVQGVSCGAILSTYQRLRVENVCGRLGFTPLTYLWQRGRGELLDEMIGCGIEAVIVKIAGGGLTSKHLGKSLGELKPTLYQLHGKYGLDICGEGGEYETIVLNCPLYKNKRIHITSSKVLVDDSNCDSVANLKVLEYALVDKDIDDNVFHAIKSAGESIIQKCVDNALSNCKPAADNSTGNDASADNKHCDRVRAHPKLFQSWDGVLQTQIIVPQSSLNQSSEAQMTEIMSLLRDSIPHHTNGSCSINDVVYVHLYLRDMSIFAQANNEYCKFFGAHPPSRSCIAPGDGSASQPLVAIDAVIYEKSHASIVDGGGRSSRRDVLHVKGYSEWAPVCIGPYSQANSIEGSLVYVAGQIPLDPPTMAINTFSSAGNDAIYHQLALCLQHNCRVLHSVNSQLGKSIAITIYIDISFGVADSIYGDLAFACEAMIAGGLLDLSNATTAADDNTCAWKCGSKTYDNVSDTDSDDDSNANNNNKATIDSRVAPIQVVGVFGLPKGASVEVEIVAITNKVCASEDSSLQRRTYYRSTTLMDNSETYTAQNGNCAAEIEQLPLWRSGRGRGSALLSEPYLVNMTFTILGSDNQLCSGIADVSLPSQLYPSHFLHNALCLCYREIVLAAAESKVRQCAIKYIKLYYNSDIVERDDILAASSSAAMAAFNRADLPVMIVPSPRRSAPHQAFSVSFLFYDLLQMKTESWVDGA